jgi:hypothetical protein
MTIDIGRFSEAPSPGVEETGAKAGEPQKPPQLVYGSAEEFLHEQLLPTYVRDVDGALQNGASNGISNPKLSPVWKPSGAPGNTYDSTESPASASGSKTTQTTT